MFRRCFSPLLCLAVLCLALGPARALPARPKTREDLLIAVWQTEHGLPQNAITALLQARQGYLWIGTYNGLARFDGVNFTVFSSQNTPGLSSGRITSLFEDEKGTLWVGQETGDLARWQDGSWQRVPVPAGWPGGSIRELAADASGALWLLHPTGLLLRLRDGLVIPAMPSAEVNANASFTRDARGQLWVQRQARLFHLHEGRAEPWMPPADAINGNVQRVAASSAGGLWILLGSRLREWRAGAWVADLGKGGWLANDTPLALHETLSGEVVVGMLKSGLHWFSPGASPWSLGWQAGLANDWVKVLCEDREANLWIGTAGGLNRLRSRRAAMWQAPDRWRGTPLRGVAQTAAGELYIGTEGAGLYRLRDGGFEGLGFAAGLTNPFLWAVQTDRADQLWVGTWGEGLWRREGDRFLPSPGWRDDAKIVTALLETRDGAMWVGAERGLARFAGGEWTWFTQAGAQPLRQVRTIVEDAAGRVWFGMSGGGLGRMENGVITVLRSRDGLASDFVWSLAADADGSLWIGTFGGGLCRWKDGRFATINHTHGLPGNVICHFADDGLGHYWISSFSGIFRVEKNELNRCADGLVKSVACLALTTSDGLATLECSGGFQPAGLRTEDGRLWFPTSKGLAVIDPARIEPHALPPPVLIESAWMDDQPDAGLASGRLEIPPGRHRVEIRYTGLSFTAPEKVRFRHRLTKLDEDWVDAGTLRAATYNYLPAGRYAFEVLACNDDGVWSKRPARLALTVHPHFWQTWWFSALAAGTGALALAGAYRWRMRHIGEVQQLRLRIARDLHDEVGGNLSSIALLTQMIEQQPNRSDASEVRRIAVRTVEMLKEIVWLTNPAHDRLSQLLVRMREAARQMLGGIAHEFSTDGLPAELVLPPAWRHNLLPILKESLHNAVRHGQPARVLIALRLDRRHLELCVQDDGRGFDPERVIPGDGLLNLHRRARDMGGELRIVSAPGAGTSIHLTVRLP